MKCYKYRRVLPKTVKQKCKSIAAKHKQEPCPPPNARAPVISARVRNEKVFEFRLEQVTAVPLFEAERLVPSKAIKSVKTSTHGLNDTVTHPGEQGVLIEVPSYYQGNVCAR